MKDCEMNGMLPGAMLGIAAGMAGAWLLAQDKRSLRRSAHRFANGAGELIDELDHAVCRCLR